MPRIPRSSNDLLRQSYHAALDFVKGREGRSLTQREYLDTTFGLNPKTHRPYNERTLRKWLRDERRADAPVARARAGGGELQQTFTVKIKGEERTLSQNVAIPADRDRLKLFTPSGRSDIRRAVKASIAEQTSETQQRPATPSGKGPPKAADYTRWLKRAQGQLKMGRARAVNVRGRVKIVTHKQHARIAA